MGLMVQERAAPNDAMTRLLCRDAEIVSVYLNAEPQSTGPLDRTSRWRPLRSGLTLQGVSAADLGAIDRLVAVPARADCALAAWAGGGRLRFTAELECFVDDDLAVARPWPHLLPLLRWQQRRITVSDHPRHPGIPVARAGERTGRFRPLESNTMVDGVEAVRQAVDSSTVTRLVVGSPTDPRFADELVSLALLANIPVTALEPGSLDLADGVGAVLSPRPAALLR